VDELVEKAKQRDPSIGAATVYRTMKILPTPGWPRAAALRGAARPATRRRWTGTTTTT